MKFNILGIVLIVAAVIGLAAGAAVCVKDRLSGAAVKAVSKRLAKAAVFVLSAVLLAGGVCAVVLSGKEGTDGGFSFNLTADGEEVACKAVGRNGYVLLDLPEKAGYEAEGVVDTLSGELLFDGNGKSVGRIENGDLSRFDGCLPEVVYRPVTYRLSVKSPTGAVATAAYYTVEDNPADIIEEPQRLEGYVFGGWFTDSALTKPFTGNFADYTDAGEPLALYPRYELQRWNIVWDTDGGEFVCAPTQTFDIVTDVPLPDNRSVKKEGYSLVGWAENGVLLNYFTPTVRRDVYLTAVWEPREYTLTVYPDNGGQPTSQKVTYGGYYSLQERAFKGYTFAGYTFGGQTVEPFGQYNYAADITVVAKYTPDKYAVTYVSEGQTVGVTEVTYGRAFTLLKAPERADYEFAGWYDRQAGGNLVTDGVYNTAGDTTLYAAWIKTQTIVLASGNTYAVDGSVGKVYIIGNYDLTESLVTNVSIIIRYRDNNLTLALKNAGFKAGNDAVAVSCENSGYVLTVINEGKSHIEGGDGSSGKGGACGSDMTSKNRNGGNGKDGQHAMDCGKIVFENAGEKSSLTLKSGNSGDGGNGGAADCAGIHAWVNYTPDGGNSGNVLSALNCTGYSGNGVGITFETGKVGNAGKKGYRKTWFTTEYGKDGRRGSVAAAVSYK